MRKVSLIAILALAVPAMAQLWSTELAATRAINWQNAGATIVARSTSCGTQPSLGNGIANAGANVTSFQAAINAAIALGAGANCVINVAASPTISVTSFTGSSGSLTFTGTNTLSTNEVVTLQGFTGGNTGLNGQSVTVSSATGSTFVAPVTGSGYASGTGTAVWDWVFNTGLLVISSSNTTSQGAFTIRGAGPSATYLRWITTLGNGGAPFYLSNADTNYSGGPSNVASWTAGYSQGTTSITLNTVTLGSIASLHIGSLLILDQLDNTTDVAQSTIIMQDTNANGSHSTEGGSGIGRPGLGSCNSTNQANGCRAQMQITTVTSCVGANSALCDSGTATAPYTVVISPGVYAPNWVAGSSPGAWWSNGVPLSGLGIENLSINAGALSGKADIYGQNVTQHWDTNLRGISSAVYAHVQMYQSAHNTATSNYWYGSPGGANSYGIDFDYGSCDNLIENDIFQHIATSIIFEGGCANVAAYTYDVDNYYTAGGTAPGWQQCDIYSHGPNYYNLIEGHEGICGQFDDIHTSNFMETIFRSYLSGYDQGGGGTKTTETTPFQLYAWSRYHNLVGMVIGNNYGGSAPTPTQYSTEAAAAGTCGSIATGNLSIWTVNWSGPGGTMFNSLANCPGGYGAAFSINNDPVVSQSTMRWGNIDPVTGVATPRFCTAAATPIAACTADERADGATTYPGLVSPSTTLPASFYRTTTPSFWNFPSGVTAPWPAIGPDISSGNITGVGGHAYHNPAANCYLNIMGGLTNGTSGPLIFNPLTCYANTSATATFSPTSLSFGNQIVSTTSVGQATQLKNTGGATMNISSIALQTGTQFSISANTCGATLAIGATCNVTVTFTPTSTGAKSDNIRFTDDATGSPQSVPLSGTGINAPSGSACQISGGETVLGGIKCQ